MAREGGGEGEDKDGEWREKERKREGGAGGRHKSKTEGGEENVYMKQNASFLGIQGTQI